ncbi:choline phosphate cytidylyltransferase [Pseudozyma hubeiensis SY62]|uniref:Choline phosphate cytidylyltransferase n=1 Tax=Pseudozyma hubeiensis (strain SY62) TaxID=1305764 RepID=R9P5F9_PSEHS|nr:choline phosphate cytidylyltransferase [Pseudozyma hubeiensis SY62]GAC96559.1 choline phosphate cytidylyltransferase [Pseudozyma hubeiensis SY62]
MERRARTLSWADRFGEAGEDTRRVAVGVSQHDPRIKVGYVATGCATVFEATGQCNEFEGRVVLHKRTEHKAAIDLVGRHVDGRIECAQVDRSLIDLATVPTERNSSLALRATVEGATVGPHVNRNFRATLHCYCDRPYQSLSEPSCGSALALCR